MSDFEPRRLPISPFTPGRPSQDPVPDEPFPDSAFEEVGTEREGLPPGFRMRHDGHYVDQLTTRSPVPQVRAVALRDIDAGRLPDGPDLAALVQSIAAHGLLQPLHVRSRQGRFELIGGRRRLAAAVRAGLRDVPCIVHTCDDDRARLLSEADNLREEPRRDAPGGGALPGEALGELRRSVGTIESCLHLLGARETTLRDRVALDLVRTEAARAARLVRCLEVLSTESPLNLAPVSLRRVLEHVLDAFGPERRLAGVSMQLDVPEDGPAVHVDPDLFAVGLAAALGAMAALVQQVHAAALHVHLGTAAGRSARVIDISQQAVSVPAWSLSRFFDAQWTERPGGYQAAVELAAARAVMLRHGGTLEIASTERGCRLVIGMPGAV